MSELRQSPSPWSAYTGQQPAAILVNEDSNVGAYMRENILYLVAHAAQMNTRWQVRHTTIQQIFGRPSPQARNTFWSYGNEMLQEKFVLAKILKEIQWACIYLHDLHRNKSAFVGHLNLQRRSEYMLYLCLTTICDARVLDNADFFCQPINATIATNAATESLLGYGSGLGTQDNPLTHVCTVRINAPYIYDPLVPGQSMRVKLPFHFVQLIQLMYGHVWAVPAPLFRALLARYAMFLAMIVWQPELYDTVFDNLWRNYGAIFDQPGIAAKQLSVEHLNRTLQNYSYHASCMTPKVKVSDAQVVNTEWRSWDAEMLGVHSGDLAHPPCPNAIWEQMRQQDQEHDTAKCAETVQGYWMRMML